MALRLLTSDPIERALIYADGSHTLADIEAAVATGEMQVRGKPGMPRKIVPITLGRVHKKCGRDSWRHVRTKYPSGAYLCWPCGLEDQRLRLKRKLADPPYALWYSARTHARKLKLQFTITRDDILAVWPSDQRCPVFGIDLVRSGGMTDQTPTLDRIDSQRGYERGNIRVISWRANRFKSSLTTFELEQLLAYTRTAAATPWLEADLEKCRSSIEAALAYADGTHTFADVRAGILTGRFQLWPGVQSAVVTEILDTPHRRTLLFFLAGGELQELRAMLAPIIAWGKSKGCHVASLIGREGWARTFLKDEGWEVIGTMMECDL